MRKMVNQAIRGVKGVRIITDIMPFAEFHARQKTSMVADSFEGALLTAVESSLTRFVNTPTLRVVS